MRKLHNPDLALFLIRLGLAAIFVGHGLGKLVNIGPTAAFFMSLGLPAEMAYIIGTIELLSGLAMLTGIFTAIAGTIISAIMIGAIVLVRWSSGYLGGWEFESFIFLAAIAIVLTGPGRYSFRKR